MLLRLNGAGVCGRLDACAGGGRAKGEGRPWPAVVCDPTHGPSRGGEEEDTEREREIGERERWGRECMCEREREKEGERERECVCVCVRERERNTHTKQTIHTHR